MWLQSAQLGSDVTQKRWNCWPIWDSNCDLYGLYRAADIAQFGLYVWPSTAVNEYASTPVVVFIGMVYYGSRCGPEGMKKMFRIGLF